jgi:hypothetical protein
MNLAPFAGVNPMKVFLQYQASMLRIWANNCELAAHFWDRGFETFRSAPEQQQEQQREAA